LPPAGNWLSGDADQHIIVQKSASAFYEGPDFLPTTAGSLCQNPHLRHFQAVLSHPQVISDDKAASE